MLELAPVSGFPAMTFPCLELEREKESQSQHPVLGDSTASDRDCFGGFTNLTDFLIWAIDESPFVGEVKLCPFNHPGSYQCCLFRIISSQKKKNNETVEQDRTKWHISMRTSPQTSEAENTVLVVFQIGWMRIQWTSIRFLSCWTRKNHGLPYLFLSSTCVFETSKTMDLGIISSCSQMSPWDFETSP